MMNIGNSELADGNVPKKRWVWQRKKANYEAYGDELGRLAQIWSTENPRAFEEMSVEELYKEVVRLPQEAGMATIAGEWVSELEAKDTRPMSNQAQHRHERHVTKKE